MRFLDADGNECAVRVTGGHGFSISNEGVVHRWTEDEDGNREEWTEPLCDSPVRGVFGDWVWEVMDEALDPRNESV